MPSRRDWKFSYDPNAGLWYWTYHGREGAKKCRGFKTSFGCYQDAIQHGYGNTPQKTLKKSG
jgi:hypothetical protein